MTVIKTGNTVVDLQNRVATFNGSRKSVTNSQFTLMNTLVSQGRPIGESVLAELVYGHDTFGQNQIQKIYARLIRRLPELKLVFVLENGFYSYVEPETEAEEVLR